MVQGIDRYGRAAGERPGFPFVFGIYGTEPKEETIALLRDTGACGIVIMRRNILMPMQVKRLIVSIEKELGYPLLTLIAHESGEGTPFSDRVTGFPGALALGKTRQADMAVETGYRVGQEMAAIGIRGVLAPVLDVAPPDERPVLGTRIFSSDPEQVSQMGTGMVQGLQQGGILACPKFFPGMGAARLDPNYGPVSVDLSAEEMESTHLPPFQSAIGANVPMIQVGHASYPSWPECGGEPASLSGSLLQGVLRERLQFQGVTITDDLYSSALSEKGEIPEVAVAAAAAGNDLLLIAHDEAVQRESVEAFRKACASGAIDTAHVAQSRARVESLLATLPEPNIPTEEELDQAQTLSENIAWNAVRISRDPQGILPLGNSPTGVIVPRLAEVSSRFVISDGLRETSMYVKNWFSQSTHSAEVLELPINPAPDQLDEVLEWAKACPSLVVFGFDIRRIPGQRLLMQEFASHPRLVVVPLYQPWDDSEIPQEASVVHSFGFQPVQLEAVLDLIFNGR